MRRVVLVVLVVLAVLVAGAGAAQADQTWVGNLGKPDSHGKSSYTWGVPLPVPTTACHDFAGGGNLFFSVSEDDSWKKWDSLQWRIDHISISGSASTPEFSYTVSADIDYSGFQETDTLGAGKVTIKRSDGARMVGSAAVSIDFFATPSGYWVVWDGSPTCREP